MISVEVEPRMAHCVLEACLYQKIVPFITVLPAMRSATDPLCSLQKPSSLLQEWFVCQSETPASDM